MTETELVHFIENLETDRIKFAICDIDGVLRGKLISKKKWNQAIREGLGFCNVVFGWDTGDNCYDNTEISGWHKAYPDARATLDPESFRQIPWEHNLPFFLADFSQSQELSGVCPRTLLKNIRLQGEQMGYHTQFSKEFEWFNFKETPESLQEKKFQQLIPLTPGMFGYSLLRPSLHQAYFEDLFDLLGRFGIPLEGLHTETGDGVYEASIDHTDILAAADRAVLFKTGVREIAYRHGILASFMAKWNSGLPGCGGHIHQSLWNPEATVNLFYDPGDVNKMSELLKHYIAGQLYCLPYILPMYAPTINSYKRYVEGSWAATTVSWGIENRTTALRVINHSHAEMRLETRIPGADANPYLSLSASLASGLYGIKNKLALNLARVNGNGYGKEGLEKLPPTLSAAVDQMERSTLPGELFGETFVDHFIRTRHWECREFDKGVTDWELKRYFEII